MAKFTLLEVHLDGADIRANAPFSSATPEDIESGSDLESTDEDDSTESSGGPPTGALLVVGLALVAVTAIALKKVLGGSDDERFDFEDETE